MVDVMKKVNVDYVMNKKFAEKKFGKGVIVLDIRECGMMGFLSPVTEWDGLSVPGSGKRVLSMVGAFEGLKVFRRKGVDESYFMDGKKISKGREGIKSYGNLKGFKWNDEEIEVDMGVEYFREWYVDEVKKRWGNMIKIMGKTSKQKNIILLYDEANNWFGYAELLKRVISEATL